MSCLYTLTEKGDENTTQQNPMLADTKQSLNVLRKCFFSGISNAREKANKKQQQHKNVKIIRPILKIKKQRGI